jgi:hypothetical protein
MHFNNIFTIQFLQQVKDTFCYFGAFKMLNNQSSIKKIQNIKNDKKY